MKNVKDTRKPNQRAFKLLSKRRVFKRFQLGSAQSGRFSSFFNKVSPWRCGPTLLLSSEVLQSQKMRAKWPFKLVLKKEILLIRRLSDIYQMAQPAMFSFSNDVFTNCRACCPLLATPKIFRTWRNAVTLMRMPKQQENSEVDVPTKPRMPFSAQKFDPAPQAPRSSPWNRLYLVSAILYFQTINRRPFPRHLKVPFIYILSVWRKIAWRRCWLRRPPRSHFKPHSSLILSHETTINAKIGVSGVNSLWRPSLTRLKFEAVSNVVQMKKARIQNTKPLGEGRGEGEGALVVSPNCQVCESKYSFVSFKEDKKALKHLFTVDSPEPWQKKPIWMWWEAKIPVQFKISSSCDGSSTSFR